MSKGRPLWSVPVRLVEVPPTGRRFDLRAEEATRAAIARAAGIPEVVDLQAVFDVARHGPDGLHVVGRVSAAVRQTCVVTLEPVANKVEESIDLLFEPGMAHTDSDPDGVEHVPLERPEPLVDGTVDLGAIAVEFLMLGIDPYPRQPGAIFRDLTSEEGAAGPFAKLAALTKRAGGTTR
jgi:Large ribosomal RNA subunit accumulation protein YceD